MSAMTVFVNYVFPIALLLMGLFLVVAVLMQHGKSHGLSGTIAGGAETFFGKEQGKRVDRWLGKMTTIIGIVFVLVVVVVYVVQPDYDLTNQHQSVWKNISNFWNEFHPAEQ
jgi:preprotein translocase subunit SecG